RELSRKNRQFARLYARAESRDVELPPLLAHLRSRDLLPLEQVLRFHLDGRGYFSADCGPGSIRSPICIDRHDALLGRLNLRNFVGSLELFPSVSDPPAAAANPPARK